MKNWNVSDGGSVSLSVDSVAQLDDKVLLIGGSYSTTASMRSVLLRSDDAGRTWHDAGFWLTGSATGDIFVLDAQHAWAVVSWMVESWGAPFVVFRTTDGGKTWQRARQNLPIDKNIGVANDFGICFASPNDGVAWLSGTTGIRYHYLTTDGGMTWRLVHHVVLSDRDDLPDPPRWEYDDGSTRILVSSPGEVEHHVIATLKSEYRIRDDGTVEPADNPARR